MLGKLPEDPINEGTIGPDHLCPQLSGSPNINTLPFSCGNLVKGDNRIFVNISMFGQDFQALIDTGSTESYVGRHVAELCSKWHAPYQPFQNSFARLADGSVSPILGAFNVSIVADQVCCSGPLKFLPSLTVDILLGLDWLQLLGTQIDTSNRSVSFVNDKNSFLGAVDTLSKQQRSRLNDF